jgi:tetratricopeptide (TPR) repeat protein
MKDNTNADAASQLSLTAMLFICSTFASLATAQSTLPDFKESDPVSDYLEAIDTAESELSAYSLELSDLYLGLGKSHLSKQEYVRARQAFQRGMQIERVNFGLNSLSQTPYLMSIAEAESFLGNWDESEKALENLYLINTQAYGARDPRMLPVLDELLDWYLDTYSDRSTNGGYKNLVISEKLGTRMQSILDQTNDLSDPAAPQMYRKLSHLHYFIASHIKKHGEPSESGFTFNAASTASSSKSTSHMHYRRGKLALQKVVEALELQEGTSARDQANAIAELGDWYLVFGQRASANHAYKLAYDFLGDSEQPEELQEALFGSAKLIEFTDHSSKTSPFIKAVSKAEAPVEETPVEKLPIEKPPAEEPFSDELAEQKALDEKSLKQKPLDQQPLDKQPMEISMAITSNGVPRNIEIINPPEDLDKNVRRTIFKDIRAQRYRPKLVAGTPTRSAINFPYAKQDIAKKRD